MRHSGGAKGKLTVPIGATFSLAEAAQAHRFMESRRSTGMRYGLVAEEVARRYPELVSYGADGKPQTVHYHELIPMLLNELQKQARENQRQAEQIQYLTEQSEQQVAQNRRVSTQLAQLKGMFERAMAAQKGTHLASAAGFDR